MANIDELKKRKEELELKRDIARLEREAQLSENISDRVEQVGANVDRIAKWSWYWVLPVTLLGIFAVILAVDKGTVGHSLAAILLLIPIAAKILGKR